MVEYGSAILWEIFDICIAKTQKTRKVEILKLGPYIRVKYDL